MAQHDYVINNQPAPAFRSDLNDSLQAIVTNNSGVGAPTNTFANMFWYDTDAEILYIRSDANDAWIEFARLNQSTNTMTLLNPAGNRAALSVYSTSEVYTIAQSQTDAQNRVNSLSAALPGTYVAFGNLMSTLGAQGANGVGTYALGAYAPVGVVNPGDLIVGGQIRFSDTNGNFNGFLAGTWRCMGYINGGNRVTLWLRVS